jgi:probable HAF family extracellular repeat protein
MPFGTRAQEAGRQQKKKKRRRNMKSRILTWIVAMTLFAALAIPVGLAAQDYQKRNNEQHHHYQLIDVGTFGGPASFVAETIEFVSATGELSKAGVVVGGSATSIPTTATSNPLLCGGIAGGIPDVFHVFEWQSGVVSDLGALAGANNCSAAGGINSKGVLVGASENGEIDPQTGFNQSRAVHLVNGEISDLGSFGGNQNGASGINNRGQIVGFSLNKTPDPYSVFDFLLVRVFPNNGTQTRAFLWDKGKMQDLGTLGGPDALAYLINERGQIAGQSYTNSIPNPVTGFPTFDPFLWDKGKMVDLGTLGGTYGFPLALNSRGQVVGTSNLAGDIFAHSFLWDRGVLTDLGTLGGDCGNANAINEAGDIVGYSCNAGNQAVLAFLWRNGALTNLGSVGGDPCSTANAINASNQVVGISATCDFATFRRAFLWENGSMVDLNSLIPHGSGLQLTLGEAINDRGEITVNATPPGCGPVEQCGHAVLLIPCDENHAGMEGCDYSMVDAPAATHVSPAPPTPYPAALTPDGRMPGGMFNRFRFPWGQRSQSLGSAPASVRKEEPAAYNVDDHRNWTADDLLEAPLLNFGRCTLDNKGNLTGVCTAQIDGHFGCVSKKNISACPPGRRAKQPGQTRCCYPAGCGQPFPVDLGRSCLVR